MCTKIKKKLSRELVVAQLLPSSPPLSPSPTLRSSHSSVPSSPSLSSSSSANNHNPHCYCLRPAAAAARHHHPIITHHNNNNNNNGTSTIWSSSSSLSSFQHRLFFLSLFLITFSLQSNEAALLQGCDFGNELCTESELCIPDGLFGQCYSDSEAALVRPLTLDAPLTDLQMEVLQAELARLAALGLDWPHARAQCVLAYFKLAVAFQLDYDTEFCAVRDPANIWALVQRVQNALLAEEEKRDDEDQREDVDDVDDGVETADNAANNNELMGIDEGANVMMGNGQQQQQGEQQPSAAQMMELIPVVLLDGNNEQQQAAGEESENNGYELAKMVAMIRPNNNRTTTTTTTMDKRGVQPEEEEEDGLPPPLAAGEQKELDTLMHQLLLAANKKSAEEGVLMASNTLSDRQLARLVQFIRQLQTVLQENVVQRMAEEDEQQQQQRRSVDAQNDEQATSDVAAAAVDDDTDDANADADGGVEQQPQQVFLLKKDTERFNNADMGLANTVHKIVKGGIQRVEGNRVYLRVAAKEELTEEELYKLIAYLDRKIAAPNRLYFDQFLYEDGQLSFRVLRSVPIPTESANSATATNTKTNGKLSMQLDSASGVAQAVYKRRKDIQTLAGVRVDETGIGSGQDVVPVERSQRDQLFLPILTVCALTICALLSVLAASLISRRRHKANAAPLLPQTLDQVAGSSGGSKQLYEQLCRQQHAANSSSPPQGVTVVEAAGPIRSKHSSSSSWPGDEPAAAEAANLDIGTGHVLLAFLQKHLDKPDEITTQWESVRNYVASDAQTQVAMKPANVDKNLDKSVLPYDESRVQLHSTNLIELADQGKGKPAAGDADNTYVNASKIYDSDPKNPAYIAAQAPLESTVSQFWQMVWEQGIGLLVNLCNREETETGAYCKYWPVEGSRQFGPFEVHLVSEHIWSEHYLVRSLYLKNMATQETRTVTQFHFLSWPAGGVPASNKALLEFRRKVNKSYRGRASPVLVHCTNGSGRTGTYILIDMAANRINRGIRELDIAASLEHLRDQRMGMVENEQQFKCVFSCILAHISAIHELQH